MQFSETGTRAQHTGVNFCVNFHSIRISDILHSWSTNFMHVFGSVIYIQFPWASSNMKLLQTLQFLIKFIRFKLLWGFGFP